MSYNLGIDVGISSIGFSGINFVKKSILFSGSRIFDAAENPKDESSLAKVRREKRGQRRVISRRAERKNAIRQLCDQHGLNHTIIGDNLVDPWRLRDEALKRKLSGSELAVILFHIAKRRGFQSNSKKAASNDNEGKVMLKAAQELSESMQKANYKTIGSYLASLTKKKNEPGQYNHTVTRDLLREEIGFIFEEQRKFGNEKATKELEEQFKHTAFWQRPLKNFADKVGFCSVFTDEKRAPKFSPTAEFFILWSKLNNLRIREIGKNDRAFTQQEKVQVVAWCLNKQKATYEQIRKLCRLTDEQRFNISYRDVQKKDESSKEKDAIERWHDIRKMTEKATFMELKAHHAFMHALECKPEQWLELLKKKSPIYDEAARILSFYNDDSEIEELLTQTGFNASEVNALQHISLNMAGTVDLSLKALYKILPLMEQGLAYNEACERAGWHHSRTNKQGVANKLPPFDNINNPVVNRALAQCRKVINACIREYGMPHTIIVELARDVGKSADERSKIERENKKNESYRAAARQHCAEVTGNSEPSDEEIIKYKLWKEQDGLCAYSGVYIEPASLRDSLATQVDHILPYSRTWDNSYMNKVLCLTKENQQKRNQTPVEYFTAKGRPLERLEAFAKRLPRAKAERLLRGDLSRETEDGFKERNLNDTRYIARYLKNHLEKHLSLGDGKRVQTRNGALIAHLRRGWGLEKSRATDRHHALDAIVIAASTESMVQAFTRWNKYEARQNIGQRYPDKPWETFREDALKSVENVFVSRMPRRKITGAAHEDTIRSIRHNAEGERYIVQRIPLSKVKLSTLEMMVDIERNQALYQTLKTRLEAHNDAPEKAFAEPIYMPAAAGKIPPVIRGIRIKTNDKSGININQGLASNGKMVRTDVFYKDGKYYLCPLYVYHFAKRGFNLPNSVIKANTDESNWPIISDEYFIFSLYPNDLIRLKSVKLGDIFGYYRGTDRAVGSISIIAHDHNPDFGKNGELRGIGVQRLDIFQKYHVDIFGNKTLIAKEKRCGVACTSNSKSSKAVVTASTTAAK